MTSDEIRWPTAGQKLLAASPDSRLVADVDWARGNLAVYIHGYRRAVDILFDQMDRTNRGADYLLFPFVFNWRQVIELQLKSIIVNGRGLLGLEDKLIYPKKHSLMVLWAVVQAMLKALRQAPPLELAAVDSVLADLEAIDPDSTGFRYHETKDGGPDTLTSAPNSIDVRNMHEVLAGVSEFLDAVLTEIGCWTDSE